MKEYFKSVFEIIKENWKSLVLFEIAYRVFTSLLLLKGGGWLVNRLLEYQGYSYMTLDNYSNFISHPLTVLAMAAVLLAAFFLILFESYGILSCFERSWKRERITMPGMIRAGFAGCGHFVRRYPLRWILYMAGCAPYLYFHLLIWEFSQAKLAMVTLQKVYEFLPKWFFVLLLVLMLVGSMFFSFTMPFRLLRLEDGREVREHTGQMLKGRWKRDVLYSFLLQLFVLVAVLVIYFIMLVVMVAAVKLTRDSGSLVSAVLIYGNWIQVGAGVLAGAMGTVAGLLFMYTFFARSEKPVVIRQSPQPRGRFLAVMTGRYMTFMVTVLIFALESILILYFAGTSVPSKAAAQNYVAVTAHRGGARMAPENTISAMEYAIEAMADYAEIDVQETKDGEIVLLHDNNLKRVTGLNANIWNLTYDEVSQLDAGIKFHKKFRGEKIPTLNEVIECCKGKIRLNIEIKYNGHNSQIVKKVVKIIEDQGFEDSCVLTSMNYKFLEQAKELNPKITTGYTMSMIYGDLSKLTAADFFSVKYTYLNQGFVRRAHALGKEVCAWTLNYQGDMQRMVDCGADNIITDDPELVRKVILGELEQNPSFFTLLKYAMK